MTPEQLKTDQKRLIETLRKRMEALSDSAIRKMYYETHSSRGFSPDEMRFALVAHYGMEAEWFKKSRNSLGLSGNQMGLMLGYKGEHIRQQIHSMETGKKPIREVQARLVKAYLSGYRPEDWPK